MPVQWHVGGVVSPLSIFNSWIIFIPLSLSEVPFGIFCFYSCCPEINFRAVFFIPQGYYPGMKTLLWKRKENRYRPSLLGDGAQDNNTTEADGEKVGEEAPEKHVDAQDGGGHENGHKRGGSELGHAAPTESGAEIENKLKNDLNHEDIGEIVADAQSGQDSTGRGEMEAQRYSSHQNGQEQLPFRPPEIDTDAEEDTIQTAETCLQPGSTTEDFPAESFFQHEPDHT